jgi:N-acetylglucosamine-6-sulfatase
VCDVENVFIKTDPSGGYPKFVSQGFNEAWLPLWLQDAGYNTYYTGKLFNSHSLSNYDSPFPNGFTGSDFLLDPHTYEYLNASFQRNRDKPISHEGEYSTDVLAGKAYSFLEDAIAEKKPFFLAIAPNAPHSNVKFEEDWFVGNASAHSIVTTPPIPAARHQNLFPDAIVPRTPNFNPDEVSAASFPVPHICSSFPSLTAYLGCPTFHSKIKPMSTLTTTSTVTVSVLFKQLTKSSTV